MSKRLLARFVRQIEINIDPKELTAFMIKTMIEAESTKLKGHEKRNYVARRVADFLDHRIEVGFFAELLDGPVFFLLTYGVQLVFDFVFNKDKASNAAK